LHRPGPWRAPRVGAVDAEHGPWSPLSLDEAVARFAHASFRWWVSGGHALELHSNRSWREHDDIDISFRRCDLALVHTLLSSWDLHVAAAGKLSPWSGERLTVESHQNNVWAKKVSSGPWVIDLTISEGDDKGWTWRRDPSIRRAWPLAILRSTERGIPYLAPEIQLLFKAKNRRPKDDLDASEIVPSLNDHQARFLFDALPSNDPWTKYRS